MVFSHLLPQGCESAMRPNYAEGREAEDKDVTFKSDDPEPCSRYIAQVWEMVTSNVPVR